MDDFSSINSTAASLVNASFLAAATAAAGTVLEHDPSALQGFASNLVFGMFAGLAGLLHHSFWKLPSTSPSATQQPSVKAHQSRWNGAIGPDGEKTVHYRQGALYESVLEGNGMVVQHGGGGGGIIPPNDDADDGNLEGPSRSGRPFTDWENEKERIKERKRKLEEAGNAGPVPSYILEYAPLVHLYSHEMYWPGDIAEHLVHSTVTRNYTNVTQDRTTLANISLMNEYAPFVYLTSDDDVEQYPAWLSARHNIPNATNYCDAPGTLIWIDKGEGVVDAFWFYYYSYNLGNMVFNVRFGNHIGDWEHSMVRFVNGEPKWIFLSQHTGGDAYRWDALTKVGKRPVIYSATGTHAMYATPGKQEYIVPLGLLADFTDNGPVWDLALNSRMYSYNLTDHMLLPAESNPDEEIEWFYFDGRWGDKWYPQSDPRQYILLGEHHYSSGPMGPRWKNLARKTVCQSDYDCIILTRLRKGRKKWAWEMDPLDGGVEIPWWALGGLDWYLVCWAIVEWVVSAFVLRFGRAG